MNEVNAMTSPVVSENTVYPFFDASRAIKSYIAEETDDYTENTSVQAELKCAELRALRAAASGQIGRLYCLVNLLLQDTTFEQTKDDYSKIALQIRDAASVLEESIHTIVGTIVEEPEPSKDEIAD
ncbi:MAG: hypothetical protein HND53_06065 [Proteobacteria bacterium]|nr:hypothetical protein [Pseudomonadota bacterium]NOG60048.1 hypothetical protein [Pseudomonadota bacterium]